MQVVGPYQLVERIGAGGMGEIFLEGAVKALTEAIAHGYSRKLAVIDDDLSPIRGTVEFQAIVRKAP